MRVPYLLESITVDKRSNLYKEDKDGIHIITQPMLKGTVVDVIAYVEQEDDEFQIIRPPFAKWVHSNQYYPEEFLIVNDRHVATIRYGILSAYSSYGYVCYTEDCRSKPEVAKEAMERYFAKNDMYGYKYKYDNDFAYFLTINGKTHLSSDSYMVALREFEKKKFKKIYGVKEDSSLVDVTPKER